MKYIYRTALIMALALALIGCNKDKAEEKAALTNAAAAPAMPKEQVRYNLSYGIGSDIGELIRKELTDLDYELIVMGMTDAMEKKEPKVTEKEFFSLLEEYEKQYKARKAKQAGAQQSQQPAPAVSK